MTDLRVKKIHDFYGILPPFHVSQPMGAKDHYAYKNRSVTVRPKKLTLDERIAEFEARVPPDKKRKTTKANLFLQTEEWKIIRARAIELYGKNCLRCGTRDDAIHVDHIKPKSKYPELALDINNLQVLCRHCNFLKATHDETDYRPRIS